MTALSRMPDEQRVTDAKCDYALSVLGNLSARIDKCKYDELIARGKGRGETHLDFVFRCLSEASR